MPVPVSASGPPDKYTNLFQKTRFSNAPRQNYHVEMPDGSRDNFQLTEQQANILKSKGARLSQVGGLTGYDWQPDTRPEAEKAKDRMTAPISSWQGEKRPIGQFGTIGDVREFAKRHPTEQEIFDYQRWKNLTGPTMAAGEPSWMERHGNVQLSPGVTLRDAYERFSHPVGYEDINDPVARFQRKYAGKALTMTSALEALGTGAGQGVVGLTSPENLSILAAMGPLSGIAATKVLVDAGFSATMASDAARGVKAGYEAWENNDPNAAILEWTSSATSAMFAWMAGREAFHTGKALFRYQDMRENAMNRLNTVSENKFGKPWQSLDGNQQAEILYNLANDTNAPITAKRAQEMGMTKPSGGSAFERARDVMVPLSKARTKAEFFNRDLATELGALPLMRPVPEIKPVESTEKVPYRPVTGGIELPETESMYMTPRERAERYYTIEEARKRLDEERALANREDQARAAEESENERIRRERTEQFEGERTYRAQRAGREPVVKEKRTFRFDVAGAEANKQEYGRLTSEMDKLAEEHMYVDADDMVRSLSTQKTRGKALEDWQRNVIKLDAQRKELLRLSDPSALEPLINPLEGAARETQLARRENEMRDAEAKIREESKKVTDPETFEKMQKEMEEARSRAEDLRSERERAEAARAAQTAQRQVYPIGAVVEQTQKGRSGEIILPDRRKIPFHYAVVPLDQLLVSHDPTGNFEPVAEYPDVLQPRDYKNNKETQAGVIAGGASPEPALVISDAATGHEGPPVIRADGVVTGGNGRSMRMKLAYKQGKGDVIRDYLVSKAEQFGLDREKIPPASEKPVLVRVLDEPFETAEELAQLGRDLNRTETMGFNEAEAAVTAGRAIKQDTLDWISNQLDAMGDEESTASLRDLMRYRSTEIIDRMIQSGMIEPTKRAEYITSVGEMTEKAKDLFESAVLGRIVDDPELLATTPREILRKLDRAVAPLARVKAAGGLWDFTPELQEALKLWKSIDSIRPQLNEIGSREDSLVEKYLHPGDFENGTELMSYGGETVRQQPHPTVEALAKLLEGNAKEIKDRIAAYADQAEGKQITIGPPPEPVDVFNSHIGSAVDVEVPKEAWGVIRPATEPKEAPIAAAPVTVQEPPRAEPTQKAPEEMPAPPVGPPVEAAGTPDRGVTAVELKGFLDKNPQISPIARPLMEAMGTVVKNALGMDLDSFLRKNWASVRGEGEPGKNAMPQDDDTISRWVNASKRISIVPAGEQLGMFGPAEKAYNIRNEKGQEALVLESQLEKLTRENPKLGKAWQLIKMGGEMTEPPITAGAPIIGEQQDLFQDGISGPLFDREEARTDTDHFRDALEAKFPGKKFGDLTPAEQSSVLMEAQKRKEAQPRLLFQEQAPVWYVKSETVLSDPSLPGAQSGEQWAAMLRNKGVKADEMKWIGLDDFLKGKRKVTRQEVRDFIRENQLQVTEIAHSGEINEEKLREYWTARNQAITDLEHFYGYSLDQVPGGYDVAYTNAAGEDAWIRLGSGEYSQLPQEVRAVIAEVMGLDEAIRVTGQGPTGNMATKYSQYTLPGDKKNYTELLLTVDLPPVLPSGWRIEETKEGKTIYNQTGISIAGVGPEGSTRELLKTAVYGRHKNEFTTSHFDERNIIAHVRLDERTDASGKRVLFIEEVQSDWHQKGKKYGYKENTPKPTSEQIFEALRKSYRAHREQFGDLFATENEMQRLMAEPLENSDILDPDDRRRILADAGFPQWTIGSHGVEMLPNLVPNAPFKSDWHELAMKRMLRWATDHGFDKIAWVTGEQTANRYNLAKHITKLLYEPPIKGGMRDQWIVSAQVKDGNFVNLGAHSVEDLPNVVGKEVAERMISGRGELSEGATNTYELSGLDLKVGGEWAKNLYDKAIPNFLSKYGKKWDAKVGRTELSGTVGLGRKPYVVSENNGWYVEAGTYREGPFDSEEQAQRGLSRLLESKRGDIVHSLDVTPEMKRSVSAGQALFQAKKGATEFLDDGRAIVYLFQNADASTFLHEFFHTMRRYLKPEDAKVLEDWLKIKDGVWSVSDEEKAARAWEYYHRQRETKGLPEGVRAVFAKIQDIMRQIYAAIKGSPLVKPSPEVSRLFDRWYGMEMEAPPVEARAEREPMPEPPVRKTREKIAPASETKEPRLSEQEREGMELKAQGGKLPLDTEAVREKVFPGFNEAAGWARTNQSKIKGIQMYQLKDGRVVADFTAKNPNVLFQSDYETERDVAFLNVRIGSLMDRLKGIVSDAERAQINRQIKELREKRESIKSKATMPPPPGAVATLWTPEGEVEVPREEPRTIAPRATTNDTPRTEEPRRVGEVSEQPERPAVPRTDTSARRPVRTAGEGKGPGGEAERPKRAYPDVKPIAVAESPMRGPAAYTPEDWARKAKDFRLPPNAPAPTRRISDVMARLLMPGQREVVESALSGLDQHDGYVLATTTGSGKTFTGSAILADTLKRKPDAKILILTPSQSLINGRDGWKSVAGYFDVDVNDFEPGKMPSEPGVYISTWAGALNKEGIEYQPWDLVIADETQEARKWWSSQRGAKLKTMGEYAHKIIYSSATPFHTALELGTMTKLGLWRGQDFGDWAIRNELGVYRDRNGELAGGNAPKKLEKLRQQLIERGQMINVDRDMNGYAAHFGKIPLDGKTAQGLKNIREALALAEQFYEQTAPGYVRAVRAQATTLAKRWLEVQRLPQAIELAKKLENEGWKVIFFSENKKEFSEIFPFLKRADDAMGGRISAIMPQFPNVVDVLKESFGDDLANFSGADSAAREREKDDFNDGVKKHLYATYGAGGVGVSMHDTQGEAPRAVIYLGPPWSGITFDQALGRPWRYGTKSNVRAYFLFSDAQAEMDLVMKKVAPRMQSLRAMVSGVDFKDPVVKNLLELPENQEAALDYDQGNEQTANFDDFVKKADGSGVTSYAELPIVSAVEAYNKGMRLPGGQGAQSPMVQRLWQTGAEDEILPPDLEAPELKTARQVNIELADRFIKTGAAPGNAAGRSLNAAQRQIIADTVLPMAEAAAASEPASAVQQVYTQWENAMKRTDAILSEGNGGGMEPPPGGIAGRAGEPTPPEDISGWNVAKWSFITNGRDVIRAASTKAGVPQIGDTIARSIAQYHIRSGNISGPWTERYWGILKNNKITPEEHDVMALTMMNREKPRKWVDNELARKRSKTPMNDRIARAVDQVDALRREVFRKLRDSDIYLTVYDPGSGRPRRISYKEFDEGAGYWPMKYDYDKEIRIPMEGGDVVFRLRDLTKGDVGEAKRSQIINGMRERYGLSRAEVEDFLASKKRQVPLRGHLERAREVDMPFARTDPDTMIGYLEGAGELLSRSEYFGQDGSKVQGLIAQIPDQSARNIVREIVENLLQYNPMENESRKWLRFAADWSVVSKMTFSSLKVLGHPVHGALMTNTRAFLKALLRGVGDYKNAHKLAELAGSIQEQTKVEMLSEFGINKRGIASTFLRWNGWQGMYKWGRVVADANARVFMTDYAMAKLLRDPRNEIVRRQLREFMMLDDQKIDDAIARRRWSDEDLAWAGKAFSDKVMFTFDPTELPPMWRARADSEHRAADLGLSVLRASTLLKGYQFKTHALLKDAIWDEARKGNFRPLIPFLTMYPLFGQLIWSLTALATVNVKHFEQLMDDKNWAPRQALLRAVEDIAHQIGDSQITTALEALVRGKTTLGKTIIQEEVIGPVMSDILRTIEAPFDITHPKTTAGKLKAARRTLEQTAPIAKTAGNVLDVMTAPPVHEEMKPLPAYNP